MTLIRLGPSASEAGDSSEKVADMLKALTTLQACMKEPWAKKLMAGLNFFPDNNSMEEDDAKSGLPAPANPSRGLAPVSSTPISEVKDVFEAPEVGVTAEAGEKPFPPPAETETINSSTHRAAHARLARRMSSLSEAECPNMHKLWSGSRKDSGGGTYVGEVKV